MLLDQDASRAPPVPPKDPASEPTDVRLESPLVETWQSCNALMLFMPRSQTTVRYQEKSWHSTTSRQIFCGLYVLPFRLPLSLVHAAISKMLLRIPQDLRYCSHLTCNSSCSMFRTCLKCLELLQQKTAKVSITASPQKQI